MDAGDGLASQRLFDLQHMRLALELAARGEGFVEPNPMVGCVLARGPHVIAKGWHARFGGPHAEVDAIANAEVDDFSDVTLYVTLEPCCHHGKTPPCTDAIIQRGIRQVVVGSRDPFPAVDGGGIRQLEQAGVRVLTGVMEYESRWLNAPYFRRQRDGRPWLHAKWAMTLDGKIATRAHDSQWISNPLSRNYVHQLRGRMDGILVGSGTVVADDPRLTARPPGPRVATRIVLDRSLKTPPLSHLVRTAREIPVVIVADRAADPARAEQLRAEGCEVWDIAEGTPSERLQDLFRRLAQRDMTHVLVEGGSHVLGSLLDAQLIDEVHVFIAPLLVGGRNAVTAVGGTGIERMEEALRLKSPEIRHFEHDVMVHGRVAWPASLNA